MFSIAFIILLLQSNLGLSGDHPIDVEGRIVGGVEVKPVHKYPFQVFIYAGGYVCGGSILDSIHVLTAKHCLYNYGGELHNPSETFVYVGAHDRPGGSCGNNTGEALGVLEFITRDDYNETTYDNDIAILRLEEGVEFNEAVQLIEIARSTSANKSTAVVTGWGGIYPHDPDNPYYQQQRLSCQLMETELDLIPSTDERCKEMLLGGEDSKICAFKQDKDSCQGDSGGPLFITLDDGQHVQIGIVSYGYGCATSLPGVYTNVEKFNGWVEKILNQVADFDVVDSASILSRQSTLNFVVFSCLSFVLR